jgi:hypothetical protein
MQTFLLTFSPTFCMIKRFIDAAESDNTAQCDVFEFAPISLH